MMHRLNYLLILVLGQVFLADGVMAFQLGELDHRDVIDILNFDSLSSYKFGLEGKRGYDDYFSRDDKVNGQLGRQQFANRYSRWRLDFNGYGQEDGLWTGNFDCMAGSDRTFRELITPQQITPGDWVPGRLDSISNGAFTIAPDNGSPVPYRLNGFVDLEKKLPWVADF